MFKFLPKFFIFLSTFLIGIIPTNIFQLYTEPLTEINLFDEKEVNSQSTPIRTNLCLILDYPEIYEGNLVVFEANAFVINDEVLLDSYVRCR